MSTTQFVLLCIAVIGNLVNGSLLILVLVLLDDIKKA